MVVPATRRHGALEVLSTVRILLACLALVAPADAIHASVWRVSGAGPERGADGRSWATAFTNIFEAADLATTGDQIWVREGRYTLYESSSTRVFVRAGVGVYGGFAGTEEDPAERAGGETLFLRIGVDLGGSNRLDRLTIRRASPRIVRPLPSHGLGGGVSCYGGVVEITDCRLEENGAGDGGGGYFKNTSLLIRNCILSSNEVGSIYLVGSSGAALYVQGGRAEIVNCRFLDNDNSAVGSVHIEDSNFVMRECTFVSSPGRAGRALGLGTIRSAGTVTACRFLELSARGSSAGMVIVSPRGLDVSSCLFYGASLGAPDPFEALRQVVLFDGAGLARFVNNTIVSNALPALRCYTPGTVIANNLIVGNETGLLVPTNRVILKNNDVFGNFTNYVDIPDPTGSSGNLSAAPLFAGDLAAGDARLQPGSPCRNAGDTTVVVSDFDLDGRPRVQGTHPDIGASESAEPIPMPTPPLSLHRVPPRLSWIGEADIPYQIWRSSDLHSWSEWIAIDARPTNAMHTVEVDLNDPASYFRLGTR